jgi:ABC-type nitrate/sulfonate/bicarbonate transport system substrate-binding protein
MREKQVDGFAFSAPTSVQPVSEGYAKVWLNFADIPEFKQLPWIDVVTSKTYLKNNREAVVRFVRALYKASEDLKKNPDAAKAGIKAKYYGQLDQKIFDLAYGLSVPTAVQGIDPTSDGLKVLLDTVNATSDNKITLTMDQLYDTTVLRDAKK